jgi:hypothetical protein
MRTHRRISSDAIGRESLQGEVTECNALSPCLTTAYGFAAPGS